MGARFRALASALGAVLALAAGGALAQPAAAKTPAACRGALSGGPEREQPPAQLPGALEAPVLAEYGVFARPQLSSDLLPPVNSAGLSLEFRMASYYAGEIRQLIVLPDGRRYMAVPGFLHTFAIPPAICLPKVVRRYRAELVEEETRRRTQPAFCIVELGARRGFFGGSEECVLFGEVADEQGLFSAGLGPESGAVVSIVPNGVGAVRVVYPDGSTVTAPVSENALLLNVPATIRREQHKIRRMMRRAHVPRHASKAQLRGLAKVLGRLERRLRAEVVPVRIEWLGPGGSVVKLIPRPKPTGARSLLIA